MGHSKKINELKFLNNLSTNLLKIGQSLKVKPTNKNEEIESINTYIVQKGDNLYSIANKYDTSVAELKKLNNLSTNVIQINQVLKIPSKYSEYIIKKGDTLWNIAKRFRSTVSHIAKMNGIEDENKINIGQQLFIPSAI